MKIEDLTSQFKKSGPALANRFKVYVADRDLDILCESVAIPGRQLTTADHFTSLKSSKRVYGFENEDISITWLTTNDWKAYDYVKAWQDRAIVNINSPSHDFKVRLKSEYYNPFFIEHLDTKGVPTKRWNIYEAFPTGIQSFELGNSQENTIVRFTATFSYENWDVETNPIAI